MNSKRLIFLAVLLSMIIWVLFIPSAYQLELQIIAPLLGDEVFIKIESQIFQTNTKLGKRGPNDSIKWWESKSVGMYDSNKILKLAKRMSSISKEYPNIFLGNCYDGDWSKVKLIYGNNNWNAFRTSLYCDPDGKELLGILYPILEEEYNISMQEIFYQRNRN